MNKDRSGGERPNFSHIATSQTNVTSGVLM